MRKRHDNQTGFAYHKALKVLNENVVVPFAVTKQQTDLTDYNVDYLNLYYILKLPKIFPYNGFNIEFYIKFFKFDTTLKNQCQNF